MIIFDVFRLFFIIFTVIPAIQIGMFIFKMKDSTYKVLLSTCEIGSLFDNYTKSKVFPSNIDVCHRSKTHNFAPKSNVCTQTVAQTRHYRFIFIR